MHEQLMQTYADIMASLAQLPDDIAGYQSDLTDAKLRKVEVERELDRQDAALINAAGGYKGLGSNEKERELALDGLRAKSNQWQGVNGELSTLTRTVAEMTDELNAAERQYGAVCYMARMHAALLTYLGSAGPVTPVTLPDFTALRTNGNGKHGAATVADAAELGL